jgi:HK97 family phage prohead protease
MCNTVRVGFLDRLGRKRPEKPEPAGAPRGARFSLDAPQELLGLPTLGGVAPRINRREALQVPAVLRARNLVAGSISTLPIRVHAPDRSVVTKSTFLLPQPDPDIPTCVVIAETVEDLFFEGVSWWHITQRGWHNYPTAIRHVPHYAVHVSGSVWPQERIVSLDERFPYDGDVYIDGVYTPDSEIIRFDSPNPPLLWHAARAIRTCLLLDQAAALYARDPMPMAYFTPQPGADPASDDEIQAVLDQWEEARHRRATGYVNAALSMNVAGWDPQKLQLAEARQHAVLEIARAAGIDPEDLGVSTTSRTYQNGEQRRQDLLDFTLGTYVSAIQDRLCMGDVLPRGYCAKVDFGGFLRSDTLTRMQTYEVGLSVGAYVESEVREMEGLPPLTPAQKAERAAQQAQHPPMQPSPPRQPPQEPRYMDDNVTATFAAADQGNITTPDAGDLNAAARKYAAAQGWAMKDGSYPIRPVNNHGRADLEKAVHAVGRGSGSHDAIRRHITSRARALGLSDLIPDGWGSSGAMSAESVHVTFDDSQVAETFAVNAEKRTISGLLMPWNQVGRSGFTSYKFAPGSLQWGNVSRVKLFRDHDYSQPLGVATSLSANDDGLHAKFKVARNAAGDELLGLAQDGIIDGLSAGIDFGQDGDWQPDPTDESVRYVRRATLREGSATALPAFDNARVTSVAANRDGGNTMGSEPTTEPQAQEAPAAGPDLAAFTAGVSEALSNAVTEAFNRLPLPQQGDEGPRVIPAGRVQVTREEPVYRFNGHGASLVRDAWKHRVEGDTEARDRLHKFSQQQQDMANTVNQHPEIAAQFNVSRSNASGAIPPGYRPDLYVTELLQGRPLTDNVSRGSLTDATPFTIPKFTSATGATSDNTEGTNPSSGSMTINTVTVTPGGISGIFDLTREIVDASNPAIDAIAMQAMQESYSQQTEAKVYAELNGANGQGGTITSGFVPSGAQVSTSTGGSLAAGTFGGEKLLPAVRAAMALYPFRRFAAPNRMHLSQEGTSAFAGAVGTDGRPLLPSVGAMNAAGLGNAVTQGWYVDGLAAVPTWSMTGNAAGDADVLMFNSNDVWAWESSLLTFRFEEKNGPANIQLALFGYFATRVLRPVGIAGIRHTVGA